MRLVVVRKPSSPYGVFGELFVDTGSELIHLAYTLEPCVTSGLLMPKGSFPLSISYSPKFRRNLPLIDVPGHSGVRIHAGNNVFDTTGCLLVGLYFNHRTHTLLHSSITLDFVILVIKRLKFTSIIYE